MTQKPLTERPILFNGEMVRAILEGRKTQTRRVIKPQPVRDERDATWWLGDLRMMPPTMISDIVQVMKKCPYGQPGDRLWVREAFQIAPRTAYRFDPKIHPNCWQTLRPDDNHDAAVYREGWTRCDPGRWKPSIHMPRWASRITLEVTDVRVEQLRAISQNDARAEGFDGVDARAPFHLVWNSVYASRGLGWEKDPWVWVVEFRRIDV